MKEWMGHQPRDRGSVWHLGPLAVLVIGYVALAVIVIGIAIEVFA